jgi:hypothetical protein
MEAIDSGQTRPATPKEEVATLLREAPHWADARRRSPAFGLPGGLYIEDAWGPDDGFCFSLPAPRGVQP